MTDKAHTDGYCAPIHNTSVKIDTWFKPHKQPTAKQIQLLAKLHVATEPKLGQYQSLLTAKLRKDNGVRIGYKPITAMPAEIDDYLPSHVKSEAERSNFLSLLKASGNNRELFHLKAGAVVMETEFLGETYLFLEVDGLLSYVCELTSVELKPDGGKLPADLPTATVFQASVWQDPDISKRLNLGVSIAQAVFEYQLDKNLCILSDQTQSRLGKQFWMRMVRNAISKSYKVYALTALEETPSVMAVEASKLLNSVNDMHSYYAPEHENKGHVYRFLIKK